MNNNEITITSAPPGHGSMKALIFKLLGVDKKAMELYTLEQKLGEKPYYRSGERW